MWIKICLFLDNQPHGKLSQLQVYHFFQGMSILFIISGIWDFCDINQQETAGDFNASRSI
jgi:hypothetical protein